MRVTPTYGYNGTAVRTTSVALIDSLNRTNRGRVRPWQIALNLTNSTPESSLVFSGFSAFAFGPDGNRTMPFDHTRPTAFIRGSARVVKGYTGAMPPRSPVSSADFNSSELEVQLVPLAQSKLRITALPVLG